MKLPAIVRALRPQQWSKNLFVLAVLGFAYGDREAGYELTPEIVRNVLLAFAAFCLVSSAVYLLNDVVDVESDRAHPVKKKRPVAAGEISVATALGSAVALVLASLVLASRAGANGRAVVLVLAGYALLNLAYSFWLKRVVLVDAFCIAGGFLLRVKAGGLAADAPLSHWLLLCTLFLSLFLALGKRRAELGLLGDDGGKHRSTLEHYRPGFLDQLTTALAACTIICYTMYAVDAETVRKFGADHMLWSVPFVVFGIGRYMFLVDSGRGGSSPTRIFLGGDPPFLLNSLGWLAVVATVVIRSRG